MCMRAYLCLFPRYYLTTNMVVLHPFIVFVSVVTKGIQNSDYKVSRCRFHVALKLHRSNPCLVEISFLCSRDPMNAVLKYSVINSIDETVIFQTTC